MAKENEVEKVVAVHPLLAKKVWPIQSWNQWLKLWEAADNLQSMEGLLHVGFNIDRFEKLHGEKEYDEIDRLIFYFSIADGHDSTWSFRRHEDGENSYHFIGYDSKGNRINKNLPELRQQLARKAFSILCQNFFDIELKGERENPNEVWEKLVLSERLLPVIQNFFRLDEGIYGDARSIYNRPSFEEPSHWKPLITDFLLNLAKFMWKWREDDPLWYEDGRAEMSEYLIKTHSRIDSAKPWMIEVLNRLDKLDILRDWTFKLDKDCINKLKEISLRNKIKGEFYYDKERPVATIGEACYVGSKAAMFLKMRELRINEYRRLQTIIEFEKRKEKAIREI